MKLIKTLATSLIVTGATILAAQAQAAPIATITVAGYTFTPSPDGFNHNTVVGTFKQTRTAAGPSGAVGDTLSGSGTIAAENNQKLNFFFSGLTSTGISGNDESFSGGQFDVFTAGTGEFLARFAFNLPVVFNYVFDGTSTKVSGTNSAMLNLGAAALDSAGTDQDLIVGSTATITGNLISVISSLSNGQSLTIQDRVNGARLGLTIDGIYNNTTSFIPEPASLALAGLGLLGIAGLRRRKQKA